MCTQNIRFRDSKELFMQRSLLRNNTLALCFDQQHPPGPRRCETIFSFPKQKLFFPVSQEHTTSVLCLHVER